MPVGLARGRLHLRHPAGNQHPLKRTRVLARVPQFAFDVTRQATCPSLRWILWTPRGASLTNMVTCAAKKQQVRRGNKHGTCRT
jgi:hypothetical protein